MSCEPVGKIGTDNLTMMKPRPPLSFNISALCECCRALRNIEHVSACRLAEEAIMINA